MLDDSRTGLPDTDLTRRAFTAATLATGFALAVQPVSAQTIKTDADGLEAGEVKVPVADGTIPAYRALPDKGGPFPVVLVVQEIFGVHEHIKDLCRRLAKRGYYAIAPEMYVRQGDVSKLENIQDIIAKVVSKVPDAQVLADLDAAVAYVKGTGKADTARLAVTGFCWGGRIVWLYAAHNPNVKAGAAWYGRLVGDKDALHPTQPVDVAANLKAPVIGFYGGADDGIPLASIETMRTALKSANKTAEIVVYPDAPHGFNADYRPTYRKDKANDAWTQMLAWFQKYGAA